MTKTPNRGPELSSALFSERAAAVVEGDGATILQINVEGLNNSKLTIIEQLAHTNKVTDKLSQETHCKTTEKLNYPGIHPSCIHLEQTTLIGYLC